jgi:hypothetical protein
VHFSFVEGNISDDLRMKLFVARADVDVNLDDKYGLRGWDRWDAPREMGHEGFRSSRHSRLFYSTMLDDGTTAPVSAALTAYICESFTVR